MTRNTPTRRRRTVLRALGTAAGVGGLAIAPGLGAAAPGRDDGDKRVPIRVRYTLNNGYPCGVPYPDGWPLYIRIQSNGFGRRVSGEPGDDKTVWQVRLTMRDDPHEDTSTSFRTSINERVKAIQYDGDEILIFEFVIDYVDDEYNLVWQRDARWNLKVEQSDDGGEVLQYTADGPTNPVIYAPRSIRGRGCD